MKRVRVRVSGRVQGVWFRDSCRREAERLGLTGFVRNEPDGTVAVEAEGADAAVDALVAWCRQGPPGARVSGVDVESVVTTGGDGFEIRW
jgi:acylphosphatase